MRLAVTAGAAVTAAVVSLPLAFAGGDSPPPPAAFIDGIPPAALGAYQQWGDTCPGLDWALLAAVGAVESGHGTTGGATIAADGTVTPPIVGPPLDGSGTGGNTTPLPAGTWAGTWGIDGPWLQAVGPMQFLPATFTAWAVDGDADGDTDPHSIGDAVATAANYLCGSTDAVSDPRAALGRYNASDAYADDVLQRADSYRHAAVAQLTGTVAEVLANPAITIYADGRADLEAGRVDPRVVALLATLGRSHTIAVTSLVTGHSRCAVTGQAHDADCVISNHYLGRAVDIAVLDGAPVSRSNIGAIDLMRQIAGLPEAQRPNEIGGPVDTGEPGVFTNSYHQDHLHFGWDR